MDDPANPPPITTGPNNYQNRSRYTWQFSPLDVDAWRTDISGKGGALDCPTTEAIVTVEFVKDRLIVYCERSTWEFVYTGNQAYPFTWQQINTELGVESTFSIVPFDKVAIGVGNVGVMACNGSNVERIDSKIPDEVFKIHNTDGGVFRVYGIRDYFVEMIYWTFPDETADATFPYPSKVLVFNYKTGTWSFNDDSITCFGYFQPTTGISWDSTTVTWDQPVSWSSGALQAQFRQVIAGNQQGYTFIVDADEPTNEAVMQITDIQPGGTPNTFVITAINHNLRDSDYVYLEDITQSQASPVGSNLTLLNNKIFKVATIAGNANQFGIVYPTLLPVVSGIYSGGGVITRVSNINIVTKEYNFYAKQGRNAYISKVDFMVDNTSITDPITNAVIGGGELQVGFFASTSLAPLLQDSIITGSLVGTSTLDTFAYETIPFEKLATRLWHPVYFQAEGEVVQFQLTMSEEQITRVISITSAGSTAYTGPSFVDFQLNAIILNAQPTGRLQ